MLVMIKAGVATTYRGPESCARPGRYRPERPTSECVCVDVCVSVVAICVTYVCWHFGESNLENMKQRQTQRTFATSCASGRIPPY